MRREGGREGGAHLVLLRPGAPRVADLDALRSFRGELGTEVE